MQNNIAMNVLIAILGSSLVTSIVAYLMNKRGRQVEIESLIVNQYKSMVEDLQDQVNSWRSEVASLREQIDKIRDRETILSDRIAVSYTHLTLPTSDLV